MENKETINYEYKQAVDIKRGDFIVQFGQMYEVISLATCDRNTLLVFTDNMNMPLVFDKYEIVRTH
jgi:hypothetical protein